MNKVVCFTGHRPNKFSFGYNENHIDCIKLKSLLIKEIENLYKLGYKTFMTGCAMGVDIWCSEIVLDLKQKYDDIKLYCVIPFENQSEKWNHNYKIRHKNIIKNCDKKILIQNNYSKDCYEKRNKFMVCNYNVVIGVYMKKYEISGTKSTLNYALTLDKKVIVVEPVCCNVFYVKNKL